MTDNQKKFISQLAHDIKNPVGNAIMYTEMMISDLEQQISESGNDQNLSKYKMMSENIKASVESLITQVDSWAAANKLKCSEYRLNITQVELTEVINGAIAEQQLYLNAKKITVTTKFMYESCMVDTDEFLVAGVFKNLLAMMLIYAATGDEIIIRVDINGDYYDILVEDKYDGNRENIINRFKNGVNIGDDDVPVEGILKPAGYGLMFCGEVLKKLETNHNVVKAINGGLTFTFRLPLA